MELFTIKLIITNYPYENIMVKKKTNLVTKEEKDFFSITKRLKSASYI